MINVRLLRIITVKLNKNRNFEAEEALYIYISSAEKE